MTRSLFLLLLLAPPVVLHAQLAARGEARGPASRAASAHVPPSPWQAQDPADSVYRAARQALNRNEYRRSAELFARIRQSYPRSAYTPDAYYWEAFSHYRQGSETALRAALELLSTQARDFASAATYRNGDARSLEARINGELARMGDPESVRAIAEAAEQAASGRTPRVPTPPRSPTAPRPPSPSSACRGEDDVQSAGLNALLQMDAERAVPILRRVLARRDPGSECLRRRAVFIVSQKRGADTEAILLEAARNDPDAEVRSQGVFWLSQVNTTRAAASLDSILQSADDPELQKRAIFALSQNRQAGAGEALRRYAARSTAPVELRADAIFWLGQGNDPASAQFLRTLYGQVSERALKDRIIFSLSQHRQEDGSFFLQIARNSREPLEQRKQAVFWMGQRRGTSADDLAGLYDSFADRDLKQHLIFTLAQKKDRSAVDRLLEIAERERDPELRKNLIFWLGQTNDPRAAEYIARLLERP